MRLSFRGYTLYLSLFCGKLTGRRANVWAIHPITTKLSYRVENTTIIRIIRNLMILWKILLNINLHILFVLRVGVICVRTYDPF